MPSTKEPVQQETSKVVAVAVGKDGLSEGLLWSYAILATALAWALLQLHG
jgi:hypothetical protein